MTAPSLTPRQGEVWRTLSRLTLEACGRPPTVGELGAALGIGKGAVTLHMQALRKLGVVVRLPGHTRCWAVAPLYRGPLSCSALSPVERRRMREALYAQGCGDIWRKLAGSAG